MKKQYQWRQLSPAGELKVLPLDPRSYGYRDELSAGLLYGTKKEAVSVYREAFLEDPYLCPERLVLITVYTVDS